jgi:hypothetical protein
MLTVRAFALGTQGLADSLRAIGEMIAVNMKDVRLIAWARRAMWEARLPVNATPTAIALAIYAKQRDDMVFAQDPYATELLMSAIKLLCLDPEGECVRGGDCDDNVIVLGGALMSVGVPVRLLVRSYPGMAYLHIMIQYDADPRKRGDWRCFDATSPSGACWPGYSGETVVNLEVGPMIVEQQEPELLILGQPPAPPAGATSMTDAQTSGWLGILAQAKDKLDASVAALLLSSGQLDAVRSDLGMPQSDPTPPPEAGAPTNPILAYGANFAWTAEAQNAQAKLVQTALFASGVMADAIAGARALYWDKGDLYVGSLPGDPYGVLMKPSGSAAGAPLVPTYIDLSSGSSNGQVGFGVAPIVIGLAIGAVVVLSIASAYAVTKICDYLAGAHRDDAVSKVAAGQQALVAGGHATPEQAAAMTRALADLEAAPPPGASRGFGVAELVAAGAVGLAHGIVGAFVVPKVLSTRLSLGAPAAAAA